MKIDENGTGGDVIPESNIWDLVFTFSLIGIFSVVSIWNVLKIRKK